MSNPAEDPRAGSSSSPPPSAEPTHDPIAEEASFAAHAALPPPDLRDVPDLSPPSVRPPPMAKKDGVPAFYYGRRKKRGNEICQILIRNGDVSPENVRTALKLQEERGGQIGRILVSMGATTERALSRGLLEQLRLRGNPEANLSLAARENPGLAGLKVRCSPVMTTMSLVLADLLALALAAGLGLLINFSREWVPHHEFFVLMATAFILCAAAFPSLGLYGAMAPSPPDELRLTTSAVTLSFVGVAALAIFGDKATRLWTSFSVGIWWLTAIALVPLFRAGLRMTMAHRPWWGHPVVVLGAARTGRLMIRTLHSQPSRGLKPVFLLDDDPAKHGTLRASWTNEQVEVRSIAIDANDLLSDATLRAARELLDLPPESHRPGSTAGHPALRESRTSIAFEERSDRPSGRFLPTPLPPRYSDEGPRSSRSPESSRPARGMFAEVEGVPLVGDLSLAPILAKRLRIAYAIVAMPGVDSEKLLRLTERSGGAFSHLLIIPDLFGFSSIGVPAKDVGGVLGIEVRQQLLLPGPFLAKRIIDCTLTMFGLMFIWPILGLLALLIKLDSRGPVVYWQTRLGRNGQHFRAAKFRTMHGDGEERLRAVLENDPKLKAEYEEFHKLQNDPRVTRIGRILRKYSLDEFPQLWNVLRGEMSLVGPRPYLEREIKDMEQKEGVILRAMPGMTGMWQVSDRNATGFSERLRMDVHYVRNWSPWLDIWVLANTVGVVVRGTGV